MSTDDGALTWTRRAVRGNGGLWEEAASISTFSIIEYSAEARSSGTPVGHTYEKHLLLSKLLL